MRESRKRRQKEAAERAELRAERSPEERLAVLDRKLGKGQGAQKERARLQVEAVLARDAREAREERANHGKTG